MMRALRRMVARLARSGDGAAAVEFALILPILLLLYIGSIEASQLIITDRRVTTVAGTLGDLVARSKDSISTATLNNYFGAASSTMGPTATGPLTQVVSLLGVDASGNATVKWSKAYPATATPRLKDSAFDMSNAPHMRDLAKGRDIVVSEAYYTYHPMVNLVFSAAIPLSRTNFYLPRFPGTISCC
ncbi:hypothetical protein [Devosia sp. DBB001]|nr:hypothetical protein [Devosia sp. DBB001]